MSSHPPDNFFVCFSRALLLTNSFIFFYNYEGWLMILTPLLKTENIANTLLSWSQKFYLYLLFCAVHGFKPCAKRASHPLEFFFFAFSIVLLLTGSSIFILYFWRWWIIPTPLLKTANIADTLLSFMIVYIVKLYLYLLFALRTVFNHVSNGSWHNFYASGTGNLPLSTKHRA